MPKDIGKTLGILASCATIITTCIAAIALIPTFCQWLSPPALVQYVTPSDNNSPTSIPSNAFVLTPTKISIDSLDRLTLLTWFEIPRKTKRLDVDRIDTILRRNRSESVVTIPNYPLSSKFSLDEYGYLFTNGKAYDLPIGNDVAQNLLNIDWGKWENYLGVFDFVIPTDKNLQFCGFYVRSESGGLNWQDTQRFIYSADITDKFVVERASWVEIKECYDVPSTNWAKRNAQNAAASSTTDSVYYWDKLSNAWVQLK
ncbi:MAG: hypothetical protein WA821_10685 [Anaerolineales bacterium]